MIEEGSRQEVSKDDYRLLLTFLVDLLGGSVVISENDFNAIEPSFLYIESYRDPFQIRISLKDPYYEMPSMYRGVPPTLKSRGASLPPLMKTTTPGPDEPESDHPL